MFKEKLYRVAFGFAAFAALGATTVLFAQGDDATKTKRPLSVRSIRPFQRSETPANQAPNLYDKKSDEFDYFREELGRSETSTKTKKRLQEIESRVVYADPMDKPAYDGSPFVDIYSDAEILNDGEPFEDPEDPDVKYAGDENNILAIAAAALDQGTTFLSLATGVSASTGASGAMNAGSGMTSIDPEHPMPDMGDGRIMVSVGPMPNGSQPTPPGGGPGGAKDTAKSDAPSSSHDDTKLVFPTVSDAKNPFEPKATAVADEAFDFFKADREFKPTATSAGGQGGANGQPFMGSAGAGMPDMGGGYPADVKFDK